MQSIESYATNDALLRVLLQGDPKAGKTVVACQFPGAYIIDVDVNLAGPLRFMRKNGLAMPVGYSTLDRNEAGEEVPMALRYTRLAKLLIDAQNDPVVQTIVIDSATSFIDILMEETKRLQPGIKDGRQIFGFFFSYGKQFLSVLKQIRKHIVLIVHEKFEKTADGAVILPYRISWPGQLGHILASFFTDVWRAEVTTVWENNQNQRRWIIRTASTHEYKLGNSLGLPDTFVFNWATIQAKLDEIK